MAEQTWTSTHLNEMSQQEFATLVEAHQRELRAHCYRILGSVQEADEMVQETFWRAWERRETYEGRAPIRNWLYKIATNLCIDLLRQRPRRGLPVTGGGASSPEQSLPASVNEPVWLEPFPYDLPGPEEENPEAKYSRKESIELAFMASLHLLPPYQRAVLILRDVLDWRADEVAQALDQTVPSVKSALHRARTTLEQHRHRLHFPTRADRGNKEILQKQLDCYVKAWETANVDALVALLREDCAFSMPPTPGWYSGKGNIAALVSKTIFGGQASGRWRLAAARVNGQPGFGLYRLNEEKGNYGGYGIQVVTFDGELISDITTFRNPALLKYFDLPSTFAA